MRKHYYWEADAKDGSPLEGCGWWPSLEACLDELIERGLRNVEAFAGRCTA
jgi:hypothetical protein